MQGYNLEFFNIPGKRNPTDKLSKQDKKDALGRKTAIHDANADLVKVMCVLSDADDVAIQEALMELFNAQTRDQAESVAVEDQALKAKRSVTNSDQAIKASDSVSDQLSPLQPESESKTSRSV